MFHKRRKRFDFGFYSLIRVERQSDYKVGGHVVEITPCKFDFFYCGFCVVKPADCFQIVVEKALNSYADSVYADVFVKFEFLLVYAFGIALYRPLFKVG